MRAARHAGLRAAQVRHEHGRTQVPDQERPRNDLGRVRHLRQQLRRHERAHFDLRHPGRRLATDPFEFVRRVELRGDALQAVAGADFADPDVALVVHADILVCCDSSGP